MGLYITSLMNISVAQKVSLSLCQDGQKAGHLEVRRSGLDPQGRRAGCRNLYTNVVPSTCNACKPPKDRSQLELETIVDQANMSATSKQASGAEGYIEAARCMAAMI